MTKAPVACKSLPIRSVQPVTYTSLEGLVTMIHLVLRSFPPEAPIQHKSETTQKGRGKKAKPQRMIS